MHMHTHTHVHIRLRIPWCLVQIFARRHNLKPGWVGLGNQLDGVQILEPEMRMRYEARYGKAGPDGHLPLNF